MTEGPKTGILPATGKLPRTAVPERYRLHLRPDLGTRTFEGDVAIALDVPAPSRDLVLHAVDLAVRSAALDGVAPAGIATDPQAQTLTLRFARAIDPGPHELVVAFSGRFQSVPQGLFLQPYQEAGQNKVLIASQLEPTDARRIFPLWDEPAYRAVFELTADVPASFEAISNMPVATQAPLPGGARRVAFEPTPRMPSYLFVFCAGEFEALGGRSAGVDLRVLTARGKRDTAAFALASLKALLPWYNTYFGVPYPLPKLDLIALPGGFGGAMENWGGITFNESALLFDPHRSSQGTKEAIYSILAHEVAHQWFGNLVTMAWWDDLWLNEGFASWMATKATDRFHPEWRPWPRASRSKNWAMDADARSTTHPIQQPVVDPAEAASAFDEITYDKGEAVIRMLEGYLGERVFRDGIRHYMKAHAYGNATTEDLWSALAAASGKPVDAIARSWTEQPGVPLVVADLERHGRRGVVRVSQQRFTLDGVAAEALTWQLPLVYGVSGRRRFALLDGQEARLPVANGDAAIKLNWGDSGYFRIWHRGELARRLRRTYRTLPEADRVALLADAWALALARVAPVTEYLSWVGAARADDSVAVWKQVLDAFDELDSLLLESPGRAPFHAAARAVLRPLWARLGWESRAGEPELWALLRSRVVGALGHYGEPAVRNEALRRFRRFLEAHESLPGNLRPAVFGVVGRHATLADYAALHDLARSADRIEDKHNYYDAMARTRDPELARRTLAVALTDEAEPTVASNLVLHVAEGDHRDLAAAFAREHLPALLAKRDAIGRHKYLGTIYEAYSDPAKATELEELAARLLPPEAVPEVRKSAERIRFRAVAKAALLPGVDRWAARADRWR